MANHYSGKRVAGRKPVGKRALSLLMALVMSLSLVQITAFAVDEGETTFENQVMTGWFTANGGTANTGVTNGKGFTLSKTIEQTGVNAFDITLTVETTQTVTTSDAAVQLIIDTSGSMAFCSVCGKERHGMKDTCKGSPSRLDATKAAVAGQGGFLDQLLAGNKSGGKIWVSVVEFANGAYKVCNWTDIRTSKGLQDVKKAVNDLEAGGGTNLDAGLMLAYNRLNMASVKEISKDNKYTVLLTDGEPTYHTKSDSESTEKITGHKGAGDKSSAADINAATKSAANVKDRSTLYTICYGAEDDVLSTETKVVCENCGKSQREHEKVWVVDGHHWLWGDYGHYEYYCDADHTKTYQKNTEQTVTTVGSFLKNSIASKPEFAFSDAGNVNKAFTDIATSTTTGMNGAGTFVTDPMGQFIKLSDEEKTRLGAISGVSVDVNTIKWNLDPKAAVTTEGEGGTKTYKYTLTYSITLDTAARGFESNTNYPTNGRTFLTIPAEEGAASEVDFNIPGVFGKVPQVEYTVNYFYQSETADADGNREYVQDNDATVNEKADLWSQITVADKAKENYTNNITKEGATPALSSQVVTEDGCIFNVYYDWNEPQQPDPNPEKVSYTVKYFVEDAEMPGKFNQYGEDKVYEISEGQTEATLQDLYTVFENVDGWYLFDAETTDFNNDLLDAGTVAPSKLVAVEGGDIFYLYYKLDTTEPVSDLVDYVIEYYYRDSAADEYVLAEEETIESNENTQVKRGDTLRVPGTIRTGYVLDEKVDGGSAPGMYVLMADKTTFKLYYTMEKLPETNFTYTVKYFYRDSDTAEYVEATDEFRTGEAKEGVQLTVLAGQKSGYTFTKGDQPGVYTLSADKHDFELYYTKTSSTPINPPVGPTVTYYSVTVNYYDKASGETIHTPYTDSKASGSSYDVTAQDKIAIEGYTYVETTGDALTGTLNGSKAINVYYSKDADIDDGDTPTTPAEPGSDIGDDDVPTTPAQPPKTGDSMGLWIAAALVSGMGLVWLALSGKKREERA